MSAKRTSLLERSPATARAIFWAFIVATINFGIWALATHAATPPPSADVATTVATSVGSGLYVGR